MTNQRVLITGASRGIGRGIALSFAKAGFDVIINYVGNQTQAEVVLDEVKKLNPKGQHKAIQADISQPNAVKALFDEIKTTLGPIHVLINNAGIAPQRMPFEQLDTDTMQKVMNTNVLGLMLCTQAAIPHLKANKGGSIINISSESAIYGGNQLSVYAASKGAVNSFSRGLSRELAPFNIRVNVISPGVIQNKDATEYEEGELENLQRSIPLGRVGSPEDIGETAVWLAQQSAGFIAGALVSLTGAR